MKFTALGCVVALIFLTVTTFSCLASDQTTSWNEVMAFVDEAATYVNNNGVGKALEEFNNPTGSFVRGDLYIFAYDLNGTCIAHPINPELVGQTGLSDINGVDVVSRELALAKRGGWDHVYSIP